MLKLLFLTKTAIFNIVTFLFNKLGDKPMIGAALTGIQLTGAIVALRDMLQACAYAGTTVVAILTAIAFIRRHTRLLDSVKFFKPLTKNEEDDKGIK